MVKNCNGTLQYEKHMVICNTTESGGPNWQMKTEQETLGLLIGDTPLSRFIFGNESKRKTIDQLQADGWPIFRIAGKHAARPERLREEVLAREQAAVERKAVSADMTTDEGQAEQSATSSQRT
jgi:hypothetical protein